jgi:YHS domain-containing protein
MARFIVILVLLIFFLRAVRLLLRGIVETSRPLPRQQPTTSPPVKLVRDPICGTHIPPGKLTVTTGATTHYFCSEECRSKFRKSA